MTQWCMLVLYSSWLRPKLLRWDGNAFECIDAGSFEHHLYVARMSLMNVLNIWIFICMLSIIFFLIWAKWIFLWVHLDRQKKTCFFLCVYFFFLCVLTHRKISFNLGEHNFSVRVRPTEKLFLTTHRKIWFFCHSISVCYFLTIHRQKNIFPWVFEFFRRFLHTENFEFPVLASWPSHQNS